MIPSIENMNQLLPLAVIFGLITVRFSFLVATAPVLSSKVMPMRVKAVIVTLISFMVYLGLDEIYPPPSELSALFVAMAGEASIGAAAGLVSSLAFAAVEGGGRLMGIPMGLGFARVVDPLTSSDSVVTSRFLGTIFSLMFLALDIHHVIIRLVSRSFDVLPPGTALPSTVSAKMLVYSAAAIFESSVQLAAPVLILLLGIKFAIGILARVAPKLNLLILSFAIAILVGLFSLKGALPQITVWMRQMLLEIEPLTEKVLRGF